MSIINTGINKAKWVKNKVLQCTNWLGYHFTYRIEKKPLIIMHVDGGLSSQIVRVSVGKLFEEAGFDVKYELNCYNQKNKRRGIFPYRISKCFPDVIISEANSYEVIKYKLFYDAEKTNYKYSIDIKSWDHRRPLYLSGYSTDYLIDQSRISTFFDINGIEVLLNDEARNWLYEIEQCKKNDITPVGVHVRRGDMAKAGGYWKVLSKEYFIEAINLIPIKKHCKFFFFSNGFDFVTSEIIPYLDVDYSLIQGTNYDYEDFYLLSKCAVQIGSQGSWGTLAYLFNQDKNKKLITYDRGGALGADRSDTRITIIELEDRMFV